MNRLFLILLLILIGGNIFSQKGPNTQKNSNASQIKSSFEGIIKFSQETFSDTIIFTYYIKGDKVKLVINEDCGTCDEADEAMIFDLTNKSITAVKPSLRMYKDIPIKPYVEDKSRDFIITQNPRNYKTILGYKCIQWRVKNIKENTEISYWVTKGNFYFFDDLLKLWNRTEKQARYYLKVPNSNGFFPLVSIERNTLREIRMTLKVIYIKEKRINPMIFVIPPDYKEL
jgi:hypothetical protein